MHSTEIKKHFSDLQSDQQDDLLVELQNLRPETQYELLQIRGKELDNKQGSCPKCSSLKYIKNGSSKGVKRYKCRSCKRCFTSFTDTLLAHIIPVRKF